jgi:hypothetical protein
MGAEDFGRWVGPPRHHKPERLEAAGHRERHRHERVEPRCGRAPPLRRIHQLHVRDAGHGQAALRQCKAALQRQLGLQVRDDVPLIGFIGRLDHQKGVDIIADAIHWIAGQDVQLVMLGTGRPDLEDMLRRCEAEHRDKVRAWVGFGALGAPHHGGRGRPPADAVAVRDVRAEPALRDGVRDRARGARRGRAPGHGGAVRPVQRHRAGVDVRPRGGESDDRRALALPQHVPELQGELARPGGARHGAGPQLGPRRRAV